jgi:signal transduction histidine kinase
MPQVDPTSNIEPTLLKRPTLTQEDERPTVSRELHAELTQVLGALLTYVQDLLDDPRPSGYARTRLQKIRALAKDAIRKSSENTLLLRDCAMPSAFKADTPNEGVDLQKER